MLDHIGFAVSDFKKSKAFYAAALQPLGIELLVEVTVEQTGAGAHAGFGAGNKAFFWIGEGGRATAGRPYCIHRAKPRPGRGILPVGLAGGRQG